MLNSGRAEIQRSADIVTDEFGALGTYAPQVGDPVELAVVMTYGAEVLDNDMTSEIRDTAEIRMADVAMPVAGDMLTVDAETWTVDTFRRSGACWLLTLLTP